MSKALAVYKVFSRSIYRSDYARAKVQQTCIVCGRPDGEIYSFQETTGLNL